MSVKGKVKSLNKELSKLRQENIKQANHILFLENILKFAITNHIGSLKGGMMIDSYEVKKMKKLKLKIDESPMEPAYIIRIMY